MIFDEGLLQEASAAVGRGRNIPTEIVLSTLRTARTARDDDEDDDDDDDSSIISVLSCPVNSDRHATKKKKHDPDDDADDDDENDTAVRTHIPTNHKKTKSTTTQRHGAAFSFTFLSQLLQKNRRRRSPGLFTGTIEDHKKRRRRRTTATTAPLFTH